MTPPAMKINRSFVERSLSDFGDDADECFSQATSMIFLYYASWQVWAVVGMMREACEQGDGVQQRCAHFKNTP